METASHTPTGEVSCRVTASLIQQLIRMNLPVAHVAEGTNYTLGELQVSAACISWNAYLVFFENIFSRVTAGQFVALWASHFASPFLRPLLTADGIRYNPAKYYERIADPRNGVIQQLFHCLETRCERVGKGEVIVELQVCPGFTLPSNHFWESLSISLEALTTIFDLAPSAVTWKPINRGASYHVRLPKRRLLRYLSSLVLSWFGRDSAEDLRVALNYSHERTLRLEQEIDAPKQSEGPFQNGEMRLRRVTAAIPGIVYQYHLDPDGSQGFTFVSGGAVALTGYTPEELLEIPGLIWQKILPEYIPDIQASIVTSAKDGSPWHQEFRIHTKAGDERWVRGHSVPEPPSESGRILWNGILTDITTERAAVEALATSKRRLKEVADNLPGMLFQVIQTADGTSYLSYISERVTEYLGYTPDEMFQTGRISLRNLLDPVYHEEVSQKIQRSADSLSDLTFEGQVRRADGTQIWLRTRVTPTRTPNGDTMWNGVSIDVSEQKRIELALRQSEERFRLASEAFQGLLYDFDRASGAVFRSAGVVGLLGYHSDELPHTIEGWGDLVHPDDRKYVFSEVAKALEGQGDRIDLEYRLQHRDGHYVNVWDRGQIVRDPETGIPTRIVGSTLDQSARKRAEMETVLARETAEKALARVKIESARAEQFQRLVELAGQGIGIAKLDTSLTYLNPFFRKMFELPAEDDGTGHFFWDFIPPDNHPLLLDTVLPTTRKVGYWTGEFELMTVSGRRIPVLNTIFLLRDPDGTIVGYANIAADISPLKEAEERLRISEDRLQQAVRCAGIGIFDHNLETDELYWSPQQRVINGSDPDEPVRLSDYLQLIHPDDKEEIIEAVRRTHDPTGDGAYDIVHRIIRPNDGQVRWLMYRGRTVFEGEGEVRRPIRTFGAVMDITERKHAEVRQASLANILQESLNEIYIYDRTSLRFLEVNRSARTNIGYEMIELREMTTLDLKPAVSPDEFDRLIAPLLSGNTENIQFETIHLRKDGTTYPVEVRLQAGTYGDHAVLISLIMDITERKRAEQREMEHVHRLERLAELSITLSGEPGAVFELVVRMIGELFGVRTVCLSQIVGSELLFRAVYQDGEVFANAGGCPIAITPCSAVQADKDVKVFDRVMERFPQAEFLRLSSAYSYCGFPSLDNEKRVVAVTCLLDDKPREYTEEDRYLLRIIGQRLSTEMERGRVAAERKQAEEALRESEERLRVALSAATVIGFVWDPINDSVVRYFSTEPALPLNVGAPESVANVRQMVHPDDREIFDAGVAACLASGPEYRNLYRVVRPNGEVRWLEEWGTLSRTPSGEPIRLIGISIDVTERKRAEEQLRDSLLEKVAMLKEIHHRVKNNLQVISSLLNLQAERIADPAVRAVFLESQNRVRAMALVHETLYGSESLARIVLPRYIERLCDSLLQTYGTSSRILLERRVDNLTLDLERALPIGLIVSELVSNALKYAFPDERSGQIVVAIDKSLNSYYTVVISDNGIGLPSNLDIEQTSTLGLYLVRVLTRQLRGNLEVTREGGTTFLLRFSQ